MAEVPTKKQAEKEVVEQSHTTIKRLPWYKRLWEWFIALFVNEYELTVWFHNETEIKTVEPFDYQIRKTR
mgnify:CR=1 FL=1